MRYLIFIFIAFYQAAAFAQTPIFHPACMKEFVGSDWEKPFDMKACSARHSAEGLEQVARFPKPTYSEGSEGNAGYVRYTVAAQKKHMLTIEYEFINKRSRSVFKVFTMSLKDDGTVEMLASTPFGDRCNDGYAEVEKSYGAGDDQIIISTYATAFRLLNPSHLFDWRDAGWRIMFDEMNGDLDPEAALAESGAPRPFNGWLPYEDITNGAVSCAGRIHWKFDEAASQWGAVKFVLNKDAFTQEYVSKKKEIKECLSQWVDKYWGPFESWDQYGRPEVAASKWLDLVSKIPEVCEAG